MCMDQFQVDDIKFSNINRSFIFIPKRNKKQLEITVNSYTIITLNRKLVKDYAVDYKKDALIFSIALFYYSL